VPRSESLGEKSAASHAVTAITSSDSCAEPTPGRMAGASGTATPIHRPCVRLPRAPVQVCPRESGQIHQRVDTGMVVIDEGRVQQPSGSFPSAVQQLLECRCGDCISSQARVSLTDRTVGLSSVMPNNKFSRRHDVLLRFRSGSADVDGAYRAAEVSAEWMDHALPDAGTVRRAGQN
jgi:hypothetical protein